MYDEFIILSTGKIINVYDLEYAGWYNSVSGYLYGEPISRPRQFLLYFGNKNSFYLNEEEGEEFISAFKGRYGVNTKSE